MADVTGSVTDPQSRLDSLRATIQSVSTKIDKGHGTLGKLVSDDALYTEMQAFVSSWCG